MSAHLAALASAAPATGNSLSAVGVCIDVDESGGTVIQTARIPAGLWLGQHMHKHDHQSVLVSGKARLWIDGVAWSLEGFSLVLVEAHRSHAVEAVTDVIWLCVWDEADLDRAALDATITKKE